MRIAWVVPGGVDESGRDRVIPVLLWTLERLAADHEVHVFTLSQEPRPRSYRLLGADVHNMGEVTSPIPGGGFLRQASWLRRSLAAYGPFDVLHAFWASPCGALAVAAAPRTRLMVSLMGGELTGLADIGYGCDLVPRERAKVALALTRAAIVTAPSRALAAVAEARGYQTEILPWGVPPEAFLPPRNVDRPRRLLHAASLNLVKDQTTLLHAVAHARTRLPDLALTIAGVDTLSGRIQSLARELGLDVTFLGQIPSDELRPLFAEADAFVLSSRHEAFCVAALEAAAAGLAVVGTHVGVLPELGAVTVPPADPIALGDAIVSALSKRDALAKVMREAAEGYRIEATVSRLLDLYQRR